MADASVGTAPEPVKPRRRFLWRTRADRVLAFDAHKHYTQGEAADEMRHRVPFSHAVVTRDGG